MNPIRCVLIADSQVALKQFWKVAVHTNVSRVNCSAIQNISKISMCTTSNATYPGGQLRPRRSLLYVPGNDERKIGKIPTLDVDCAVLDCEDGVAINKKTEARTTIAKMLPELPRGRTECSVRINSVDSGLAEDDLRAVFGANNFPESIVVPKVEKTQQVDWLVDHLTKFRRSGTRTSTSDDLVRLIILIESARAFLDMDKICSHFKERLLTESAFRLEAVIFGSDDFCANIGATRTKEATEVLYARQHFVTVAKAHQLQAIDMVHIDYKDLEDLRVRCVQGAQMGFTGKQVIHPGQIPVVQQAFSPSQDDTEWASELILAFGEHQKSGKGAFTFRGKMIDMPLLRQAQNIMQLASTVGKHSQ